MKNPLTTALLATLLAVLLGGCFHELNKEKGKPPPPPTGLEALGLDSSVRLSWDVPAINVPHDLYFTPEGGKEEVIENVTNPYIHQGLTNGILYTYQLVARNRVGISTRTPPVTVMPVVFNWQEAWTVRVTNGNFPLCKDDGTHDECLMISTGGSNWFTSRFHAGPNADTGVDAPLTYIKIFQNFDMTANGITYTMQDNNGLNLAVENLKPSYVEIRDLNIPVTAYTELFLRAHEAVLTDTTSYTYLEIGPTTFVDGDACLGRRVRYVLGTGSAQAVPAIPPDPAVKIVVLGDIEEFFRRNMLQDLDCSPSAYAVGTLRMGIDGFKTNNNWGRWDTVGIIGPPLT